MTWYGRLESHMTDGINNHSTLFFLLVNKQNEISANRKCPLCDHNTQFMVFSLSYFTPNLRFKCLPVTTEKERTRTERPTFGDPPFAFSLMIKYLLLSSISGEQTLH